MTNSHAITLVQLEQPLELLVAGASADTTTKRAYQGLSAPLSFEDLNFSRLIL
jgi:hypothetical protein